MSIGNISRARVVLWDVFADVRLGPETWRMLPADLLAIGHGPPSPDAVTGLLTVLHQIARGTLTSDIKYLVRDPRQLTSRYRDAHFDLIYSHAAIKDGWHIEATWRALRQFSASTGWHSHRIDLADHSYSEANYIEMREWSNRAYWLTTRFIPGAFNRWRAFQPIDCLRSLGFGILKNDRRIRPNLKIPRNVSRSLSAR